ncbi:aspartyl protease family protein-like protein [Tanacetum coccineum]
MRSKFIKLGDKKKGSLEVIHKHGPCSKFSEDVVKPLTVEEIFTHDQSRVDSIRARAAFNKGKKDTLGSKATLPAKSGITIGSSNYIVTVGLGTPKKDMSLIFDTGSDLTWTQCQPCVGSCYRQQEPIFAPSASTTYKNISCTSTECSGLTSATGHRPRCSSSTCVYAIQYGDRSFSVGFYATDKLTLTSKDVIGNFYFGCGQDNEGLFRGAAGLMGLGRDKLSLVSQAAKKYGKVFSYCLPSTASSTGYLTFGSSGVANGVKYTSRHYLMGFLFPN